MCPRPDSVPETQKGGGSWDPPPRSVVRHVSAPRAGRLARRTSRFTHLSQTSFRRGSRPRQPDHTPVALRPLARPSLGQRLSPRGQASDRRPLRSSLIMPQMRLLFNHCAQIARNRTSTAQAMLQARGAREETRGLEAAKLAVGHLDTQFIAGLTDQPQGDIQVARDHERLGAAKTLVVACLRLQGLNELGDVALSHGRECTTRYPQAWRAWRRCTSRHRRRGRARRTAP